MRIPFVVALTVVTALSGQLRITPVVVSGQTGGAAPTPHASSGHGADAAEVLGLDQKIGSAVVRGDTAFVDSVTPKDFVMVHGDGWTNGGKPLSTDTKESMLRRVTSRIPRRNRFRLGQVEMHGDITITYGRYLAHVPGSAAESARFAVWFEAGLRETRRALDLPVTSSHTVRPTGPTANQ